MTLAHHAKIVSLAALAALATALPAQDKDAGKDKKPTADQKAAAKRTAGDPAVKALDSFIKKKVNTKAKDWRLRAPEPPRVEFDAESAYYWMLDTDCGLLKIELFPTEAPRHVTSTIYLTRAGYFDGLKFPRTIRGFMAQGGCPTNNTRGRPGYTLTHEFAPNRRHDGPGILSAANAGAPNTDGSQFFLTFVPTPHLNDRHTVYGKVLNAKEYMATLAAMEKRGTGQREPWQNIKNPPKIAKAWIVVESKKGAGDQGKGDDDKKKGDAKKSDPNKG